MQAAFEKAFEISVVNAAKDVSLNLSDNAVDASVWGQSLALDNRLNFLNTEFRQAVLVEFRLYPTLS